MRRMEERVRSPPMHFSGTVYFDFVGEDSWRLFLVMTGAVQEGGRLNLEWIGLPSAGLDDASPMTPGDRALAAHAAVVEPARQERLRQALFTLVHRQGDSLDAEITYRAAARVAGVDGDVLLEAITDVGYRTLVAGRDRAEKAGVEAAPSIVRNGPPVHVRTTPAIATGRALSRLSLIDQMLDDDGMWTLTKP